VWTEEFAPGPYTVSIVGSNSIPKSSIFDEHDRPKLIARMVHGFPLYRNRRYGDVLQLVEGALGGSPEIVLLNVTQQHAEAGKAFLEGYGAKLRITPNLGVPAQPKEL
jgi:hypothetical protein